MARYIKELLMVDYRENTEAELRRFLISQKFEERVRDGEKLFQKGKGFWVAPAFVKVSYERSTVRVEAWIDAFGEEQNLEGFVGCAVKNPLKKIVAQMETILQKPGADYVPDAYEEVTYEPEILAQPEEPQKAPPSKKVYFQYLAPESFYSNLKTTSICAYVMCGISLLTVLVNVSALIDVAICLGLTLGMHIKKSKGCAIGILIYSIINLVVYLVATGSLGGWAWLVVGIYAVLLFHNTEKRYKEKYGLTKK